MNLKTFLTINGILFVPFGTAMVLLPGMLFPIFGIDLDADGLLMARVFGSSLLSLGLICYMVRAEKGGGTSMRAVLTGNFVFHLIDAFATFVASYTGVMNTLGWMFFFLHLLLALGFLFYLLVNRSPSKGAKN